MPAFQYRALRHDGGIGTGQIEAGGRQEALRALEQRGLRPLDLSPAAAATATAPAPAAPVRRKRVPARQLENFMRQLASLLAAGVPLAEGLHLLAAETPEPAARAAWQELRERVMDGTALADAMAMQPQVFPRVHVAMVQAGETGGFLDLVLRQIADFQSRDRDLRGRVLAALVYPAVLLVLCAGVMVFLMIFFIPRFQGVFADFGGNLPPLTVAIIATSMTLKRYGLFVLLGVVAAGGWLRRYLATPEGRWQYEQQLLRLPLTGKVAARFAMTRFTRMLGTLTRSGVPLITALRVARESLGNEVLGAAVDTAIREVQHGGRLGSSLGQCVVLFPASTVAMISVAEQSGRLDEELIRIADESETELDRQLRTAVSLAEPAMLLVMALFIGTIVIGMLLPIFTLQDYIK